MKKYISLFSIFCFSFAIYAQENTMTDALRYTQNDLGGTPRFRAMGGAFGALGGDMSSIQINPAGSAMFNFNAFSLSFNSTNKVNKSTYLGSKSSNSYNNLNLEQIGGALVFKGANYKKFVLGLNYETTSDFDNNIFYKGNNTNSISNYFLNIANDAKVPLKDIKLNADKNESITDLYELLVGKRSFNYQQAFFGYNAYLFNPEDSSNQTNTSYISNVAPGNFQQIYNSFNRGNSSKLNLNFSSQINSRFYIGANLNFHFVNYTQKTLLKEDRINPTNEAIRSIYFENNTYTNGSGFSLNVGAIAKLTTDLRIGASYESPTWYTLRDEINQGLSSIRYNAITQEETEENVYPDILVAYKEHSVKTPAKYTGSIAYIFNKKGLISFDYTRKNYSSTMFKPKSDFIPQNKDLKNLLSSTNEFRIGAEYRIDRVSLRAGYRFEESPYKNNKKVGNLNSISGGLGYSFGNGRLDLSYTNFSKKDEVRYISSGINESASVKTTDHIIALGYSLSF